jgi:hypothetical protein
MTTASTTKILIAANRHMLSSLEGIGTSLFFESEGIPNPSSVVTAHKEAVRAIAQLAIVLDRLGVAGICEKCHGTGESVGMSHRQPCDHCEKGLIYEDPK